MPRGRRPARTIDFKEWDGIPGLITEVSTATTVLGGGLSFSAPATVLRIRGYWSGKLDESMQVGDRISLTLGIGIVSTDAFSDIGATAVPDPSAEAEFPWLYWENMRLDCFVAAGHDGGWGPPAQRYVIDTKAMRKMKPGQTLTYMVESDNLNGAPATLIDVGQLRVLIGT